MRWLILIAAVLAGWLTVPAYGQEIKGCEQTSYESIPTRHEISGGVPVAKAVENDDNWLVVIDDKSKFAYLSDQTIQWIVFRECFFAGEKTPPKERQDIYRAEKADCWAALELRNRLDFTDRDFRTIEYDLEVLSKEGRGTDWRELLGPPRSPYLFKCL